MSERIAAALAVVGLTILGFVLLQRRLSGARDARQRALEFHNRFVEYVESRGSDVEAYDWLMHRSVRMQREMGAHGVMAQFRPPFSQGFFKNWPIVLNALPEVRQGLRDRVLVSQAEGYAQILKDALVRYGGTLDDEIADLERDARNPVVAFREGVQAVLRFPLFFLHWIGLRSAPSLAPGPLGRAVGGVATLLALLSAIVSLVVGWSPFVEQVQAIWSR